MSTHSVQCGGETFLLCETGLALFDSRNWSVFRGSRGHVYLKRGGPKQGSTVYFHRELLGLMPGDGLLADHINRNTRDNRLTNLRAGGIAQNNRNRCLKRGGAFKAHNGWVSRISTDEGRKYLGYFKTEDEARNAFATAKAERGVA